MGLPPPTSVTPNKSEGLFLDCFCFGQSWIISSITSPVFVLPIFVLALEIPQHVALWHHHMMRDAWPCVVESWLAQLLSSHCPISPCLLFGHFSPCFVSWKSSAFLECPSPFLLSLSLSTSFLNIYISLYICLYLSLCLSPSVYVPLSLVFPMARFFVGHSLRRASSLVFLVAFLAFCRRKSGTEVQGPQQPRHERLWD